VNLINGKIYVGQSLHNRDNYLGSGIRLGFAIEKYGRDNFKKEILEVCEPTLLNEREIFWIDKLDACNPVVGYNLTMGGDGFKGRHRESTKMHLSQIRKGKSPAWMQKENATEIRDKIADAHRDQSLQQSHRVSISRSVRNFFKEHPDTMKIAWENHSAMGMSGKSHSSSSKTLMSLKKGRAVLQLNADGDLLHEWRTIREAEKFFNVTNIGLCCRRALIGGKNSSAGFLWKYKE
jgi:group I intron endonuclease